MLFFESHLFPGELYDLHTWLYNSPCRCLQLAIQDNEANETLPGLPQILPREAFPRMFTPSFSASVHLPIETFPRLSPKVSRFSYDLLRTFELNGTPILAPLLTSSPEMLPGNGHVSTPDSYFLWSLMTINET